MSDYDITFYCLDCNVDTLTIGEYYMVEDDVWLQSGLSGSDGMLCIGCLEERIGRLLNSLDFIDFPINKIFAKSDRILSRMVN